MSEKVAMSQLHQPLLQDRKSPLPSGIGTPGSQDSQGLGPPRAGLRGCENKLRRMFFSWYILVLHAITTITLALSMIFLIHGVKVNSKNWYTDKKTLLRSGDIITIITTVLVIVKAMTTSWSGLAVWRCVFVLLEKDGLNLQQIQSMMTFRLPTTMTGGYSQLVMVALLLIWPAQFVAPLLVGAVSWEVADGFISNGTKYEFNCAEERAWDRDTGFTNNLHLYLNMASKEFIGMSHTDFVGSDQPSPCRRYISNDGHWPIGSTINNYALPCITIHSISWDSTPLGKDVQGQLSNLAKDTILNRPFFDGDMDAKTTVVLNSGGLVSVDAQAPPPSRLVGEKKVVIYLGPHNDTGACSSRGKARFGPSFPVASVFIMPLRSGSNSTYNACFVVGTLNLTAGVAYPPTSKLITAQVLEADKYSTSQFEEDNAVVPAFNLMTTVMATLSDQNLTAIPAWNNIDGYVKTLVSYTYFASWDVMGDVLCNTSGASQFDVSLHVGMLKASVSKWRVWVWLAINLLIPLSGIVLLIAENGSSRVVLDTAVAAIMIDPSPLLDRAPDRDLTSMSYVMKADAELGKVQLRGGAKGYELQLNEKVES